MVILAVPICRPWRPGAVACAVLSVAAGASQRIKTLMMLYIHNKRCSVIIDASVEGMGKQGIITLAGAMRKIQRLTVRASAGTIVRGNIVTEVL